MEKRDLRKLTVKQLKRLYRANNLGSGYGMKKAELVEGIWELVRPKEHIEYVTEKGEELPPMSVRVRRIFESERSKE